MAENPKRTKERHIQSRKSFYDWLAETIQIYGILSVERDRTFDDEYYYRSGGIRLHYPTLTGQVDGLKDGILMEAGFDTGAPNNNITIGSWAFEKAFDNPNISIADNRAMDIPCYHPGYTFVEKLQTVATKFRQEKNGVGVRPNLMRQYYDLYCLLGHQDVLDFIGTEEYFTHKNKRFPKADLEMPISENEAFLLRDQVLRDQFKKRYQATASLYYKGQTDFEKLLQRISDFLEQL